MTSPGDLTPADCRGFAASARRQAALANTEGERAAWIRIAREWDQIAAALEEIRGEPPPSGAPPLH